MRWFKRFEYTIQIPVSPLDERINLSVYYRMLSDVNGKIAMYRARLIAVFILRWCLAHVPVMRRGIIFPRSEI